MQKRKLGKSTASDLTDIHAALADIEVQGERYPVQMQAMVNR